MPQALREQADHVDLHGQGRRASAGAQVLEPTAEAEEAYVQEVRSLARMGQRFYTRVHARLLQQRRRQPVTAAASSPTCTAPARLRFFELLAEWRASGELPGVTLS